MNSNHVTFPASVREAAVLRYLNTDVSYRKLAAEVGASTWTLRGWVKQHQAGAMSSPKDPPARSTDERSAQEKLRLLLKARSLPDGELGEFLRQEGIREGDLDRWEQDAVGGLDRGPSEVAGRHRIRDLERRLQKSEKRLREADALLELQKKVQALWGDEDDDTSRS
jgi:transposase-like protein